MSENSIVCPHCKQSFLLTETLAAPLVERAKLEFEKKSREREKGFSDREASLRAEEQRLATAKSDLDALVQARLAAERVSLAEKLKRDARDDVGVELRDLKEQLAANASKLEAARTAELEQRQKAAALEEQTRSLALEAQKTLDLERNAIRAAASKEALDAFRLKEAEKDSMIGDLRRKLDDVTHKLEQGSQQLHGEVQELELEAALRANFPRDTIEPIAKGQVGGDCIQRVVSASGKDAGAILWEAKRTKNWSDGWLVKLREDQRNAKADHAILLSSALPKGIEQFGLRDGIWVTNNANAMPLAEVLRRSLIDVSVAKQAAVGQQDKMALVYQYISGPEFRHRVTRVVEAFVTMKTDLDKERTVMQSVWAKREKQLQNLIAGTNGLYGDLQGIVGKSLPEIAELSLDRLGEGETPST